MPKTRCLGRPGVNKCHKLIDSKLSRCPECAKAVKDERNRQVARFEGGWPGSKKKTPCPQEGLCPYCKEPAYPEFGDPFIWAHFPIRFVDGGQTVVPAHKSCNEGRAKRRQ